MRRFAPLLAGIASALVVMSAPTAIGVLLPRAPESAAAAAETPCVLRWSLSNDRSSSTPTVPEFSFGGTAMLPVVGDWDGEGGDTVGAYDPYEHTFHLSNALTGDQADEVIDFGADGDKPIAGDWDGDGKDEIAVHLARDHTFYFRVSGLEPPQVTESIAYGTVGDTPLIGDWDGDGESSQAVVALP
ncbi:MAG TPA: hypothetical protein VI076_12285 [Actinopolymorphaceae bacterium]